MSHSFQAATSNLARLHGEPKKDSEQLPIPLGLERQPRFRNPVTLPPAKSAIHSGSQNLPEGFAHYNR